MAKKSSELSELVSKILIESDNKDEIVSFTFDDKTLKCSIALLSEVSPVFKVMFSEEWYRGNKTVVMNEKEMPMINPDFDQHTVFKLFLNILYGLCNVRSLTISQATEVYYYAHKYQVDIVKKLIMDFIEDTIDDGTASTTDLNSLHRFATFYHFDYIFDQLDGMTLELNAENCYEFYQLANDLKLNAIQCEVVDYCASVEPNKEWAPEFLCQIIENLQERVEEEKEKQKKKHWKKRTPRNQWQGGSSRSNPPMDDQLFF